jgi:hypothetical protein
LGGAMAKYEEQHKPQLAEELTEPLNAALAVR